ncbi:hypothetical protein ACJIZ3_001171 [Penstemon smallii]|uniref:Secreted protein n=1 Tax=Penstemon smallii TaxID=265156 RepID=A0ABD3U6E4_9LAMI
MIQRNVFLLLASPHANSVSCWAVTMVTLPKFTYTTDWGSFVSSHLMQSESSFQRLAVMEFSLFSCTTSGSKASNVLRIRALALGTTLISCNTKLSMMSFGSVVLMKVGRSLNRMFFIPGIQSRIVSKCSYCVYPMKPHALVVQKRTSGSPNLSAASTVKLMTPSETMQLTGGGMSGAELLSFVSSSQKGSKQVLVVDSQMMLRGCELFGKFLPRPGLS